MKPDFVGILEAAYAEAASDAAWRTRLLESASALDHGLGLVFARSIVEGSAHRYAEVASTTAKRLTRDFIAAGATIRGDVLRSLARSAGRTGSMILGKEALATAYGGFMARNGVADCIGINGVVDARSVAGIYVMLPHTTHLPARTVRHHHLVGVHLGAALRSRDEQAETEAWVSPSGRILEARVPARAERDALTRRVRAIEATRTRRGRADVDRALDLWKGLVAGRWTLVERFDADGRRHFVARRNDPRFGLDTRLTTREATIASLTAMGHSQKLIAYTLGLSPPMVSAHLKSALLKLGARSVGDLVALGERIFAREPNVSGADASAAR